MFDVAARTANDEQSRVVAPRRRVLRDQVLRQVVVEEVHVWNEAHPWQWVGKLSHLNPSTHSSKPFLCFSTVFSGPRNQSEATAPSLVSKIT